MKILVIEDDRSLSNVIARCLKPLYDVDQAYDGSEGYFYAQESIYDLIILDLMLPELDGYGVLEKLRANGVNTPVLILSAKGTVGDRVRGFQVGADDYLTKPFEKEELLLRIQAILRRSLNLMETEDFVFKDLVLKHQRRQASINGQLLDLKGRQYDVLEYLVSRQGVLISKTQLFDKVWGFMSDTSSNVVEVYISHIRKELKPFGYDQYLQTIRGVGYLFSADGHD